MLWPVISESCHVNAVGFGSWRGGPPAVVDDEAARARTDGDGERRYTFGFGRRVDSSSFTDGDDDGGGGDDDSKCAALPVEAAF